MRNVSDKSRTENQSTHFVFKNFFPPSPLQKKNSYRLWDNVEKYCTAGQATDDYVIRRMRIAYWVESSWNVMAHGDAREGKWRGNWRMEWVASTLHIASEHGVSSITTADAHTTAASSRLNWRPPPI